MALLILHISALLLSLILGLIVLIKNPKIRLHQIFFGLSLSIAFWIFSVLMADVSKELTTALLWSKLSIVGPSIIPVFFLWFCFLFPFANVNISIKKLALLFVPPIFILFFTNTTLNIKEITIADWGTDFEPGILYVFVLILLATYMGWGFLNLIKKYPKVNKTEKDQIKYFFLGAFLMLILGTFFNGFLPLFGYGEASTLGPSTSLILVGFTAYAIIKRHLFDIKVILAAVLTIIMDIILIMQIIFSQDHKWLIVNIIVFILFSLLGYLLIKSVLLEIKRKEELQMLYEQVERVSKAKSEFISIASHQLRTPLTAIKGYISLVLEGTYGKITEKMQKPLESVYASNERLLKLVNDLLHVSRIESGKLEFRQNKTSIEGLISSVVEDLTMQAKSKNLYLNFEIPSSSLPEITVDDEKVRQALLNIVDNAIKYTKEGGINIEVKTIGSKCQIKVTDTGEGMTKEEISGLFESFTRGKAGNKLWTEGSGLGLYVAKKFVEMHKGRIWAESEGKGKGSAFFIELPIT